MNGTPQIELAKLHEEFPILNDVGGTLDFRINEGESEPETLTWHLDASMQLHLTRLGITERLKDVLAHLTRQQGNFMCEGRIEFDHGRCKVCW